MEASVGFCFHMYFYPPPAIYRKTNILDMKKTITESQLRQIVKESVKKVLNENDEDGGGIVMNEIEEMERMLNYIVSKLKLDAYNPIGIDGLDKERAIPAIKSIKKGLSVLFQSQYNTSETDDSY